MVYYWKEFIVDAETYINELEATLIYELDVIKGKRNNNLDKFLSIEEAVKWIIVNRKER